MKKFLTFVFMLSLFTSAPKMCALSTDGGASKIETKVQTKEKTKNFDKKEIKIYKNIAEKLLGAVIISAGTITGFYILGQYIEALNVKSNVYMDPNSHINVKLEPINVTFEQSASIENNAQKDPGWFYKAIHTIGNFFSGNLGFIYNYFKGNGEAPPPAM